jgi:TPR repeat protein
MRRLLQAAEKGDADAQFNLAMLYHNGNAADGGRADAIKWLLEAAEHGLPRAQVKLAELLAEEPNAACNHVEACFWFLVSKVNLSGIYRARAQAGYERVAAGVTPADITAVASLAERWKPANMPDEFGIPLPKRAPRSVTT